MGAVFSYVVTQSSELKTWDKAKQPPTYCDILVHRGLVVLKV